jgi:flagellar basal-body rod modification protein FlgD
MDDQSFVAQLAQFSSLEQLTNINSGISKLNTTTAQQQMFNASSLIGKEVIAAGNSVVKSGTSVGTAYYTLPSAASDVTLTITNSSGSTVRTVDLGAQSTGQSKYQWDGTDGNGTTEADGTYTFSVSATGTNGSSLSVTTASTGIVSGVNSSSGTNTITTTDGRTVNFTDVQGVVSAPTSS